VASPYLVPVAQLLRDVPSRAEVAFEAEFDEPHEFPARGPAETDVFPEATVRLQLRLESFNGGLRVRGQVEAPWHGVCRRCSTLGVSSVSVNERFVDHRHDGDEETYLIEDDFIDLAPLAHDAIFLDLPLAPLCREDCKGLCPFCGIDRNEETCECQAPIDSRWATLDGLRFTDVETGESKEV
jgi:uncharacterized protein